MDTPGTVNIIPGFAVIAPMAENGYLPVRLRPSLLNPPGGGGWAVVFSPFNMVPGSREGTLLIAQNTDVVHSAHGVSGIFLCHLLLTLGYFRGLLLAATTHTCRHLSGRIEQERDHLATYGRTPDLATYGRTPDSGLRWHLP